MPYKFRKKFGTSTCNFIGDIIDGMQDWVRVISKDDTIIFVNKSMREALGHNIIGQKCYELLGQNSPCANCVSRTYLKECPCSKEETINGHTFSVTSSPLRNTETGEVEAMVEVLHDITDLKQLSLSLEKQNKRLQQDLSMATRLQYNLLPKQHILNDKIDFSFIYRPCEMLGGDFFDIFKIDENHIGIYIADVSGHGVAASMLTMFLRASLDKNGLSPQKVLSQLNSDFNKSGFDDELYIAVFYGIINLTNHTITYSNAGLNVCPILYGEDDFQILRAPGIPISSWLEIPEYTEVTINFKPRSKFFFYTDGIIEIRNTKNEQFGEERIVEHLTESELPPKQTLSKLFEKAIIFSDSTDLSEINDDITIALIEIK